MSVYNRKMFRKKGGMAKGTGILASGPEIIKAQSGVFMGPGNPTQPNLQIGAGAKKIQRAGNQVFINPPIQTTAGGPGTYTAPKPGDLNYIPTNSSSILERLFPTTMGLYNLSTDARQKIQDNLESIQAGLKNRKARQDKNKISPMSQAGIEQATGAEPDIEAKDTPGTISDTIASLKLFKENMKPSIEDFKKTYTDLPEVVSQGVKEIFEGGTKKLTSFLSKKMKKIANDDKARADEAAFLDASGEKQGAVSKEGREILYEEEKQSRISQGFLPSDQKPGEGEIIEIGGKKKLKTVDSSGNEVIKDLSEKQEKEVSVSENAKNLGDSEYDKKQLATTEETGQGSELNKATALLDSNSEKSAKEGLTNTSNVQKLFRDGLSVLGDNKTKSNIGDILGIQSFDDMTLGERTTAYKSILKATLGEDKDIKDDASFNLIMTGLLIASGDSPDALTNIARGFANGLKMYADNISDKRKEKREIALAATKLAITADESAKERVFKAEQNRLDRVSKEFIAMASKQTSKSKLRESIYKKLVANPEGYLGLRDKLNYAKLPDSEKPAYLTQITDNLVNTFYQSGVTGVTANLSDKELEGHMNANKKAKADGSDRYTYNGQVFAVQ
jgi:hypothetical protein